MPYAADRPAPRRGRRIRDLPDDGPVSTFANYLRELYKACQVQSYRELAEESKLSTTTLQSACAGYRLPTWRTVKGFVQGCWNLACWTDELRDLDLWIERYCGAGGTPPPMTLVADQETGGQRNNVLVMADKPNDDPNSTNKGEPEERSTATPNGSIRTRPDGRMSRKPMRKRARRLAAVATVVGILAISATTASFLISAEGAPTMESAIDCDRYQVAARDLWLRDYSSNLLTQLPHGEKLTKLSGHNAAQNWAIVTDDGKFGYVDQHYLAPMCAH